MPAAELAQAAPTPSDYNLADLMSEIQTLANPVPAQGNAIVRNVEDLEAEGRIKVSRARLTTDNVLQLIALDVATSTFWMDIRRIQEPARTFGLAPTPAWQAYRTVVPWQAAAGTRPLVPLPTLAYSFVAANDAADFLRGSGETAVRVPQDGAEGDPGRAGPHPALRRLAEGAQPLPRRAGGRAGSAPVRSRGRRAGRPLAGAASACLLVLVAAGCGGGGEAGPPTSAVVAANPVTVTVTEVETVTVTVGDRPEEAATGTARASRRPRTWRPSARPCRRSSPSARRSPRASSRSPSATRWSGRSRCSPNAAGRFDASTPFTVGGATEVAGPTTLRATARPRRAAPAGRVRARPGVAAPPRKGEPANRRGAAGRTWERKPAVVRPRSTAGQIPSHDPPSHRPETTMKRELDTRINADGDRISLHWHQASGQLEIEVEDGLGNVHTAYVSPRKARDAFEHPFLYLPEIAARAS